MTHPSQEAQKLEPCPFCGKPHTPKLTTAQELAEQDSNYDGEFWEHSDSFAVFCNAQKPDGPGGCGASGGFFPTEAEAITAWNTRALLRSQQPAPVVNQQLTAQPVSGGEREAFEAWVKSQGGDVMKREGKYVSSMSRLWWECWQAARISAPQAVGWLPIEAAPKDGTYIMVANYAGAWIAKHQQHAVSGFRFDNPWRSMMLNHDHIPSALRSAPTHWQPIPAPPTQQGDSK